MKDGRQYNREDKASEERERSLPHSTFIERRWSDDTGTKKLELKAFLLAGSGVRIVETLGADYFTCRSVDRIEVRWGVDQREYIKIEESLGKCPDFTLESNNKWRAQRVREGKGPLEENHVVTVETSTIKVTLDKNEWLRKGNKEILNSLSSEFATVALDDIAKLGQMGGRLGICAPNSQGFTRSNVKARLVLPTLSSHGGTTAISTLRSMNLVR